jgi:hypothetical protein
MRLKIDNYYVEEDGKRKLSEKFAFSYSYSPGLYGKMHTIDLFVKKDMSFKLHLLFYDNKVEKELLDNPKNARIEHYQESRIPYAVRAKLSKILNENFILAGSYLNDKNTFGILDSTSIGSVINHSNGQFSIDLSPDTLDRSKFDSESEVNFLKLIKTVEKWLNDLIENTIRLYELE